MCDKKEKVQEGTVGNFQLVHVQTCLCLIQWKLAPFRSASKKRFHNYGNYCHDDNDPPSHAASSLFDFKICSLNFPQRVKYVTSIYPSI